MFMLFKLLYLLFLYFQVSNSSGYIICYVIGKMVLLSQVCKHFGNMVPKIVILIVSLYNDINVLF